MVEIYDFNGFFGDEVKFCGLVRVGFVIVYFYFVMNVVVDSVENVGNGDMRFVGGFGVGLVDISFDENVVLIVFSFFVDGVGIVDVIFGCVINEVDGFWWCDKVVCIFVLLFYEVGCEFEGGNLGFVEGVGVEFVFIVSEVFEGDFEYVVESIYIEVDVFVSGGLDNVVVGEVDGWILVEGFGMGIEFVILGYGEVEYDLNVIGLVVGVGEDEDGIDGDVGKVMFVGVF